MTVWVKICANTTLADARLAAELGADAVGFVFAPSKRRVTVERVATIVQNLPRKVEKIGVFVDSSFNSIAETVQFCGLTGVQLHFEAPAALAMQLRDRFGPLLRIVRTVHFAVGENAPSFGSIKNDPNIDGILIDSKTATATGGTGQTYDWGIAATSLFQSKEARKHHLIAAGGLTPGNVADAIRILKPWGVDVASGVEAEPGSKDAAKLRAFIANAHGAMLELAGSNSDS